MRRLLLLLLLLEILLLLLGILLLGILLLLLLLLLLVGVARQHGHLVLRYERRRRAYVLVAGPLLRGRRPAVPRRALLLEKQRLRSECRTRPTLSSSRAAC